LLKALVERYIADGQPVGSRALSKISGLDLSPATIRNIMADLEELGYVASPHTSAGRVPTPRGYRIFVDTLLTVQHLDEQAVEGRMRLQAPQPQKMITNAAQMLSSLSQFAGVVLEPRRESVFQQIEFLRLGEKRILLVIVAPGGDVQNRLLLTDVDYSRPSWCSRPITSTRITAGWRSTKCSAPAERSAPAARRHGPADAGGRGSGQRSHGRRFRRHGDRRRAQPAVGQRPVLEHEFAAPDVRYVRAEDRPDAAARCVEQGQWRADLHRRRIEPGADG
jgi:hypothetical protein